MAIVLTEQKTEQTAETTSCEQKAMTWWETSKTTPRHRQTTETTQTNSCRFNSLMASTLMSLQLRQHRLLRQHWQNHVASTHIWRATHHVASTETAQNNTDHTVERGEWGPRICPATLRLAASPPRPVASSRRRLLAVDLCAGRCIADESTSGRCPVRPIRPHSLKM